MGLLPILLFVFGIIVLGIALKVEGQPKQAKQTDPEVIAALRIIANHKREIADLKKSFKELDFKVQDQELRILKSEISAAESLVARHSALNQSLSENVQQKEKPLTYGPSIRKPNPAEPLNNPFLANSSLNAAMSASAANSEVLPGTGGVQDKYAKVLELAGQKWEVSRIAAHLGLSQDAVTMILKTSKGGGML